jgi:hypothetical protein
LRRQAADDGTERRDQHELQEVVDEQAEEAVDIAAVQEGRFHERPFMVPEENTAGHELDMIIT